MATTYKKLSYDDSPTMVDVAERDSAGNVIKDTYAKTSTIKTYYTHSILLYGYELAYITKYGTSANVSFAVSFEYITTRSTPFTESTLRAFFAGYQPQFSVTGYVWGTTSYYNKQLIPVKVYFNTSLKCLTLICYIPASATQLNNNLEVALPAGSPAIVDTVRVLR